jgi:hypothetical protein
MTSRQLAVELLKSTHELRIEFYPFHRKVAGRLTSAVLLSYLLRQFQFHKKDKIFYTDKEVTLGTTLTTDELRGAKIELKTKPFLKITREGSDGRTHYEMDWQEFANYLQGELDNSDSGKTRNGKNPNPTPSDSGKPTDPLRENTKTENTTLSARVPTDKVIDKRSTRMARQLIATIEKVRHVNHTSKLSSWAKAFQAVHEVDGIPTRRIQKALDWYCTQFPSRHGDKMFLVILSGGSFREKFDRLEMAMKREVENDKEQQDDGESHGPEVITVMRGRITSQEELRKILDGD